MNKSQMVEFLFNKTNNKFKIKEESDRPGIIYGSYDGENVFINFKENEWMTVISVNDKTRELIPYLNEAMEVQSPLCDFNMVYDSGQVYFGIEWELLEPMERIDDILKNRDLEDAKRENVNFYNEKYRKIYKNLGKSRSK